MSWSHRTVSLWQHKKHIIKDYGMNKNHHENLLSTTDKKLFEEAL
jgi:hypothetical protein